MFSFNLDNVRDKRLLGYFIFIIGLIMPGFGFLYLTNLPLFLQLDYIRLFMLSLFYTLPLILINFLETTISAPEDDDQVIVDMSAIKSVGSLLFFWLIETTFPKQISNHHLLVFYGIPIVVLIFTIIKNGKKFMKKMKNGFNI